MVNHSPSSAPQARHRSQIQTQFLAVIRNVLSSPLRDCLFLLAEQEGLETEQLNVKHSLKETLALCASIQQSANVECEGICIIITSARCSMF